MDGLGAVTRSFYDVRGNAVKTIANCKQTGSTPPTCQGGPGDSSTNVVTTTTYSNTGTKASSYTFVAGVETETDYDTGGRAVDSIADVTGTPQETYYHYDSAGEQVGAKGPSGVITINIFTTGRLTTKIDDCVDSPAPANWYDCQGNAPSDGTVNHNQKTTYSYDAAGNQVQQTDSNGATTADTYSGSNDVVCEIDDFQTGDTCDQSGVQPANLGGGSSTDVPGPNAYVYDTSGRVIESADPQGVISATVYDSDGRVCRTVGNSTIDPRSLTHPCSDPIIDQNNVNVETASQNIDTQYSYNVAGQKIRVRSPSPVDGATVGTPVITLYAYDASQRLCRVVENADPSLDPSSLSCHGTISSSVSANVDTQYTYDASGNLVTQFTSGDTAHSDPAGTTTWAYDLLGRQTARTDPDGYTTRFAYDAAGNRATQTNPDGSETFWFYTAEGQMCRRIAVAVNANYALPTSPCTDSTKVVGAAVDTMYAYDTQGNQNKATDLISSQSIASTYDNLGRPSGVTNTLGSTSYPSTTYKYQPGTITRTDSSGANTFNLDNQGRELSLADPLHQTGTGYGWAYDATGALASLTEANGNVTTYSHDALGRLTSQATSGGSGCAACALSTYSYNAAGSQFSTTSTISGDTANGTTAYTYDPLSRLLSSTPQAAAQKQTYAWDATPDRTSIKTGSASAITTIYDAASRPTASASNASDAEGRITKLPGKSGATLTLSWDPLGRLASASGTGVNTTYTYDPLDRLQTITTAAGTTSFSYVGLTQAVDQVTSPSAGGPVVTQHVTDLNGNELYEYSSPTAPSYLERNSHGDVTWTADSTGAPSGHASYDPFGNLAGTATPSSATRWQSSYQDDSSGLYYVEARWYSPVLGSFLTDDPLTADPTDPQSRDPYAYGAGDPVDDIDPSGQSSIPTIPNFPWFSPANPRWKEALMDPGKSYCTIGGVGSVPGVGCALTSAAMVAANYGVQVPMYVINMSAKRYWTNYQGKWIKTTNYDKKGRKYYTYVPPQVFAGYGMEEVFGTNPTGPAMSMDPLSLDAYLLKNGGLISKSCELNWKGHAWDLMKFKNQRIRFQATISGKKHDTYYTSVADMGASKRGRSYLNIIESQLNAGHPVIGMVGEGGQTKVKHFVVITGEPGGTNFSTNDPAMGVSGSHFFPDPVGSKTKKTPWPYQLLGIVTMHYYGPTH